MYTFTIAGDSLLGRPIQIYVYWVSHYIVYKCPSLQKTIIPLLRSTQWIWSLSRHFLSNFLDSSAVLYSEWIKKRPNCGLCPNVFPTPPPLWNFWHYFECLIVLTARALNKGVNILLPTYEFGHKGSSSEPPSLFGQSPRFDYFFLTIPLYKFTQNYKV